VNSLVTNLLSLDCSYIDSVIKLLQHLFGGMSRSKKKKLFQKKNSKHGDVGEKKSKVNELIESVNMWRIYSCIGAITVCSFGVTTMKVRMIPSAYQQAHYNTNFISCVQSQSRRYIRDKIVPQMFGLSMNPAGANFKTMKSIFDVKSNNKICYEFCGRLRIALDLFNASATKELFATNAGYKDIMEKIDLERVTVRTCSSICLIVFVYLRTCFLI
jgi:hypothetical protein